MYLFKKNDEWVIKVFVKPFKFFYTFLLNRKPTVSQVKNPICLYSHMCALNASSDRVPVVHISVLSHSADCQSVNHVSHCTPFTDCAFRILTIASTLLIFGQTFKRGISTKSKAAIYCNNQANEAFALTFTEKLKASSIAYYNTAQTQIF